MNEDNCERCEGKTRERLCNLYGYYSAAIADIKYSVENLSDPIERIKQALQVLEEVIDD